MKRIILLASLLAMCSALSAQDFYLKTGVGYAFSPGAPYSGNLQEDYYPVTIPINESNHDYSSKVPLSSGAVASFEFGYIFNENVGAALQTSYNFSNSSDYETLIQYIDNNGGGIKDLTIQHSMSGSDLAISPLLRLSYPIGEKWSPFMAFGPRIYKLI